MKPTKQEIEITRKVMYYINRTENMIYFSSVFNVLNDYEQKEV